jgi:L-aspartate oxidase
LKRYIINKSLQDMEKVEADVVIAGSGAAGLYTALNLDSRLKCVILDKSGADVSNSMYAQGGIATVVAPGDDIEQHYQDTLVAGAYLCDEKAVRVLVTEARENIEQLIGMQVPFDRDKKGNLSLTREGGHGQNRILHCGGDATGLHMTRRLYEVACARENIQMVHNAFLVDIVTGENGVSGVIAMLEEGRYTYFKAPKVVVASGGIGRVYRNSTNARCATGDGIAAAFRAGAVLKDMEFVQFHPTALVHPDNTGRFFLISEALRGEGAVLRNRRWEAFMEGVHPLADLAPRDIVTRAIIREMQKSDLPHVYLDITFKTREFLRNRFPTIYTECMRRDIDIAVDWIPVKPVQHYFMGGIQTDTDARTSVAGLYACGEAACTGVHGANRLASNSLLECLVFGRRCARDINGSNPAQPETPVIKTRSREFKDDIDFDSCRREIRELMTKKCSVIRNGQDLSDARERILELYDKLDIIDLDTAKGFETFNIAMVALAILNASINRKKSVGAHYRTDDRNGEG